MVAELQRILILGQERNEFRNFNVQIMAYAIQGAIWEYVTNPGLVAKFDMASYSEELVSIFDKAVLRDRNQ